jgi:hypothetical protein
MAHPGFEAGLIGPAIGIGAMATKGAKHLIEKRRYANDLVTRLNEAKVLTTPLSQQPGLMALINQRHETIGGGQKLLDLSRSATSMALPR